MKTEDFIHMPIPAAMFTAVCALLGGAAVGAGVAAISGNRRTAEPSDTSGNAGSTDTVAAPSGAAEQSSAGAEASPAVSGDDSAANDGEVDAHGWPWSADMHASTKGKTKEGLWRMKVGVSRPDPKPGFPVDGGQSAATGTASETNTPSATSSTATEPANGQNATSTPDVDEDEFAAFRAASEASNATDAAAAASVPPRQFSDADLGALCNQAAVKLGDPSPVKAIITKYVPAGEVVHSRNIPTEKRNEFVSEVETAAGIQFAG